MENLSFKQLNLRQKILLLTKKKQQQTLGSMPSAADMT